MDRYQNMFSSLHLSNQKAFIPFVTLGDPSAKVSLKIVDTLIEAGADALELGLPFSDPLADGPVIQRANTRALNCKTYTNEALNLIQTIRTKYPDIPIGILSYLNLVYGLGERTFFKRLSEVGVDSLLLGDLPVEMAQTLRPFFQEFKISQVFIAPPNASKEMLKEISKLSQSYIYLLGRSGVTGTNIKSIEDTKPVILELKKLNSPPILQGFGISSKENVQAAIKNGVDGVFVGSALVKIIEENLENLAVLEDKIYLKAKEIKSSCICNKSDNL